MLDWNTHHGVGTDGVFSLERFVAFIVQSGANVVSLNEVEKNVGYYGDVDRPARYAALLKTATGKTWYYKFAQRDGATNGQGNLILTTFPLEDSDEHQLSYSRSVARVQILVSGIRVNVFSTHLDADSSRPPHHADEPAQELGVELRRAAHSGRRLQRVAGRQRDRDHDQRLHRHLGGGEDRRHGGGVLRAMRPATPATAGSTTCGCRKARAAPTIKASQVFDVRNSSGVAPSDHRPVMTTFW